MTKHLLTLAAVLTLFSVGTAWGQTRSARANVPFQFNIGQQTFPAGNYQFQSCMGKPGRNSEHGMLAVRELDGRPLYRAVMTGLVRSSEEPQSKSKLVFSVRDGQKYLSQIWFAGEVVVHRLPGTSTVPALVPVAGEAELVLTAMSLPLSN